MFQTNFFIYVRVFYSCSFVLTMIFFLSNHEIKKKAFIVNVKYYFVHSNMDFILVISLLSLIISICIACALICISICIACALICIYKFLVGLVECIYNIQQPHHIQLDEMPPA